MKMVTLTLFIVIADRYLQNKVMQAIKEGVKIDARPRASIKGDS